MLYDRRDAVCQRGGGRLLAVVRGLCTRVASIRPFTFARPVESQIGSRSRSTRTCTRFAARGPTRAPKALPPYPARFHVRPCPNLDPHRPVAHTRIFNHDVVRTPHISRPNRTSRDGVQRTAGHWYDGIHLSRGSVARRPCDCITFAAGMGTLRAKVEQVGPAQSEPNLDPH